ncbi:hypothetical protein SpCBS45565_g06840 [Spizellomyces sp. 'palustris']|nr:hypothetical protein SpCBS45565_g06840 [Spizellomyces sp. 'palustris']
MKIAGLVAKGDIVGLRTILEQKRRFGKDQATDDEGEDINRSTADGRTALHVAASTSNLECLELLLSQPTVNVDAQDVNGSTALHLAAACSELAAVRSLVAAGANVNAVNVHGNRPVDYAKDSEVEAFLTGKLW